MDGGLPFTVYAGGGFKHLLVTQILAYALLRLHCHARLATYV